MSESLFTTSIFAGTEDKYTVDYTVTFEGTPLAVHYTYDDSSIFSHAAITAFKATSFLSLGSSFILMVTVISMIIIRRDIGLRPSIRLSGFMGFVDFSYSLLTLMRFYNSVMVHTNNTSMRFWIWATFALPFTYVLLITCIMFHLHLTVLVRKEHLAMPLSRGYEAFSFILGFSLPLVTLDFNRKIFWDGFQNIAVVYDLHGTRYPMYLLSGFLWEYICMFYSLCVAVCLVFKLYPIWSHMQRSDLICPESTVLNRSVAPFSQLKNPSSPPGFSVPPPYSTASTKAYEGPVSSTTYLTPYSPALDKSAPLRVPPTNAPSGNVHLHSYVSSRQRDQIRNTIIRIMLYPLILLIFRLPYTAFYLDPNASFNIYHAMYILASLQGFVNLVAFLITPGFTEFWRHITKSTNTSSSSNTAGTTTVC